jgi:hypothetical protein
MKGNLLTGLNSVPVLVQLLGGTGKRRRHHEDGALTGWMVGNQQTKDHHSGL